MRNRTNFAFPYLFGSVACTHLCVLHFPVYILCCKLFKFLGFSVYQTYVCLFSQGKSIWHVGLFSIFPGTHDSALVFVTFKLPFTVVSKIWLFLEMLNCYIMVQTEDLLVKKRWNVSTGTYLCAFVCIYVYISKWVRVFTICMIQYIHLYIYICIYVKYSFMYRILK